MAVVVLPTRTDGAQRYDLSCQLGSATYALEFFWNTRDQSWTVAIADSSGNELLKRKINVNVPLTSRFSDPRLPLGDLIAVDTSGQNLEAGLTDLGTRVLLCFIDGADVSSGS